MLGFAWALQLRVWGLGFSGFGVSRVSRVSRVLGL